MPEIWRSFAISVEKDLVIHPMWKESENIKQEEILIAAREGLEHYVLSKIKIVAFAPTPEERRLDKDLYNKTRLLKFIRPEHLDLHIDSYDVVVKAGEILRRIIDCRTPREMMRSISQSAAIIFGYLASLKKSSGADDFLPLFIFTVLQAQIPQ